MQNPMPIHVLFSMDYIYPDLWSVDKCMYRVCSVCVPPEPRSTHIGKIEQKGMVKLQPPLICLASIHLN